MRLVKAALVIFLAGILYVYLDFAVDFHPAEIQSSYRFKLAGHIPLDEPQILRQGNLNIVLIKRSRGLIDALQQQTNQLQDASSADSQQPQFASNSLRSRHLEYFIAYGLGTDFGCPLVSQTELRLTEVCGVASYDFAGRAIAGEKSFQNLVVPDYEFGENFSTLIIRP